jgi:hypothetical protein
MASLVHVHLIFRSPVYNAKEKNELNVHRVL